ncbi:hypothetical protein ADUPG1_007813 [Aduncisulcus paluster]|uniref:Uncharacterized protein n=1 Tax=Aduncisulcus paluster TaxID=2918883 RepID=A0ABQ5KPL3_9EUKA|nr:hypothetical protein ADUPG1_007813 [Aduncisulcus paluster]
MVLYHLKQLPEYIPVRDQFGFFGPFRPPMMSVISTSPIMVQLGRFFLLSSDRETYSVKVICSKERNIGDPNEIRASLFCGGKISLFGTFFYEPSCCCASFREYDVSDLESISPLSMDLPNFSGNSSGVLSDNRILFSTFNSTLAVPFEVLRAITDCRSLLPNSPTYTPGSQAYLTEWRELYSVCSTVDYHNTLLAPCSGQVKTDVDVFSVKDTLFALPVGGNRAIRLNLTDGKDDVAISTRELSLVVCPIVLEGEERPSSIKVYIGFASNLISFTLPPIDELRSIADSFPVSAFSGDPSVSIVCDIKNEFENVQVCPFALPNYIIINGKISTPCEKYLEFMKNSVDELSEMLSIITDGKTDAATLLGTEIKQNQHIPHIMNVCDEDYSISPLPVFLNRYISSFCPDPSHPSYITCIIGNDLTKKTFSVSFSDFLSFVSSISIPLTSCTDYELLQHLSTMKQWEPAHPWAYEEYPYAKVTQVAAAGGCPSKELKKAYHMKYAPENYLIGVGIVQRKKDKELEFRDEKEEEEEKDDHVPRPVFGPCLEHIPEDLRAPGFYEVAIEELGDFLGAPIVSQRSSGSTLEFKFVIGFDNGKRTGHLRAGHLYSNGGYGSGGIGAKWAGILVPSPKAISSHSQGTPLSTTQRLTFSWYVPVEEDVITIGEIPSDKDRDTERDMNTIIMTDPAYSDTHCGVIVKNLLPGRWHASKVTRAGTNGSCQIIHESLLDDPRYGFIPGLRPIYGADMPQEASNESVFDAEIEGGVNGAGWKQLHHGVGADSGRDGFFIKSMFEKKKEFIEVHGLTEGIGRFVCNNEFGDVCYECVRGYEDGSVPGGWYCQSGWGDGCYPAFVVRDGEGNAIAIRIVFIPEGGEE